MPAPPRPTRCSCRPDHGPGLTTSGAACSSRAGCRVHLVGRHRTGDVVLVHLAPRRARPSMSGQSSGCQSPSGSAPCRTAGTRCAPRRRCRPGGILPLSGASAQERGVGRDPGLAVDAQRLAAAGDEEQQRDLARSRRCWSARRGDCFRGRRVTGVDGRRGPAPSPGRRRAASTRTARRPTRGDDDERRVGDVRPAVCRSMWSISLAIVRGVGGRRVQVAQLVGVAIVSAKAPIGRHRRMGRTGTLGRWRVGAVMRPRSTEPTTWRALPTAIVVVCFVALGALAARADTTPAPTHHAPLVSHTRCSASIAVRPR